MRLVRAALAGALLLPAVLTAGDDPVPGRVQPAASSPTLTVLTWNVRKCRGTDDIRNCGRIADWIFRARADVALLSAVRTLDDAEAIRQRLDDLDTRRTWSMHYGKAQTEGQVILSAYAMPPGERRHLIAPVSQCGGTAAQVIVESTIEVSGRRVRLFAVDHEHASEEIRQCQARVFRSWAAGFDGVRIVGGDFNSSPGAAGITAWLTPGSGDSAGYRDAWAETPAAARTGYGKEDARIGNSAADRLFGRTRRTRIDHILFSEAAPDVRPVRAAVLETRDPATTCRDVKGDGFLGRTASADPGCDANCICAYIDDDGVRPSDHVPLVVTFTLSSTRPAEMTLLLVGTGVARVRPFARGEIAADAVR